MFPAGRQRLPDRVHETRLCEVRKFAGLAESRFGAKLENAKGQRGFDDKRCCLCTTKKSFFWGVGGGGVHNTPCMTCTMGRKKNGVNRQIRPCETRGQGVGRYVRTTTSPPADEDKGNPLCNNGCQATVAHEAFTVKPPMGSVRHISHDLPPRPLILWI